MRLLHLRVSVRDSRIRPGLNVWPTHGHPGVRYSAYRPFSAGYGELGSLETKFRNALSGRTNFPSAD